MNHPIKFQDYYKAVEAEAKLLGYNPHQVKIFHLDIMMCYDEGKSVQECLEIVF